MATSFLSLVRLLSSSSCQPIYKPHIRALTLYLHAENLVRKIVIYILLICLSHGIGIPLYENNRPARNYHCTNSNFSISSFCVAYTAPDGGILLACRRVTDINIVCTNASCVAGLSTIRVLLSQKNYHVRNLKLTPHMRLISHPAGVVFLSPQD